MSAVAAEPMLQVSGLCAGYGPVDVLQQVSLEVRRGEIVSLIGANGAGKSSTLRCVSRILKSRAGSLRFEGRDLLALPAHEVVAAGLAHVPEGRRIFPRLTVLENLQMGAYRRSDAAGIAKDLGHVHELFPILRDRARQAGGTLSGGEQQMLAIGRALMSAPRLLLLDEPFLGLAPKVVDEIVRAIDLLRVVLGSGTREGASDGHAWFRVVLHEGRNREVRRIWSAVGHEVSRLTRLRYGTVELPADLRAGEARTLPGALVDALDALAAKSFAYPNGVAPSTDPALSLRAVLTGDYPDWDGSSVSKRRSLAITMKEAGYTTGASFSLPAWRDQIETFDWKSLHPVLGHEPLLLATFDNAATLKAERSLLQARIANLSARIRLRQRETARYREVLDYLSKYGFR